uniref:Uncharacterized protein n=1 Tax=Cyprinus carpio carpio TaxID=630221 RepID=A0A8C1A7Y4_CYPCA
MIECKKHRPTNIGLIIWLEKAQIRTLIKAKLYLNLCSENKWKTRYERQLELKKQLEKQISFVRERLETFHRLASIRSYDEISEESNSAKKKKSNQLPNLLNKVVIINFNLNLNYINIIKSTNYIKYSGIQYPKLKVIILNNYSF